MSASDSPRDMQEGNHPAAPYATTTEREEYRRQVRAAFPLLPLISHAELRQQTEDAHIYALARSSWQRLVDVPWAFLNHTPVGDYVSHINVVTQLAAQTADTLVAAGHRINKDIVISAAITHDVGKLLEYGLLDGRPIGNELVRHSFSGVHVSMMVGLPDSVTHAIALHAWEGELELPPNSERSGANRFINSRTKEAIVVACANLLALKILRREFAEQNGSAPSLAQGVPVNPPLSMSGDHTS